MSVQSQLELWLQQSPGHIQALQAAQSLKLKDWCLAAGFVRNLIWDRLHHRAQLTPLNDIDLIYYDVSDVSEQRDLDIEAQLRQLTEHPWSVKNQARMHLRNDDAPYDSTADAMSYWVEVETAVGVYLDQLKEMQLIAPFGLSANFALSITMNPKREKPESFIPGLKTKAGLSAGRA